MWFWKAPPSHWSHATVETAWRVYDGSEGTQRVDYGLLARVLRTPRLRLETKVLPMRKQA